MRRERPERTANSHPLKPHSGHKSQDVPVGTRRTISVEKWATRQKMWIDRVCSAVDSPASCDRPSEVCVVKRIQDKPKRASDLTSSCRVQSTWTRSDRLVLLTTLVLETICGLARVGTLVIFSTWEVPSRRSTGIPAIVSGVGVLQPGTTDATATLRPSSLDSLSDLPSQQHRRVEDSEGETDRGILGALGAAALFGLSTPIAKTGGGDLPSSPWRESLLRFGWWG